MQICLFVVPVLRTKIGTQIEGNHTVTYSYRVVLVASVMLANSELLCCPAFSAKASTSVHDRCDSNVQGSPARRFPDLLVIRLISFRGRQCSGNQRWCLHLGYVRRRKAIDLSFEFSIGGGRYPAMGCPKTRPMG